MLRLARAVLIALIALAVPLQGAAAVGAAQCLAFEHHQTTTGDDPHHGHDHSPRHEHHHSGSHSHCGPCVACCASASITSAQPLPLTPAAPAAVSVVPHLPLLGDLPGGLYRPPLAL